MKIRNGFVTNSSSSSYIVTYKLNSCLEDFKDKIKEEFGNYGLNMMNGLLSKDDIVKDIKDSLSKEPDILEKIMDYINGVELSEEDIDNIYDFEVEVKGFYLYANSLLNLLSEIKQNSDTNANYIIGERVEYSNEGATDSENMFLIDVIFPQCNVSYTEVKEQF